MSEQNISKMHRSTLKEVILEQAIDREHKPYGVPRALYQEITNYFDKPHVVILSGMRRCGKSTLQLQIQRTVYPDAHYYLNFEDERLLNFTAADFNVLYEVFIELYGQEKVFFFDEIQNVPDWEIFVRRMHEKGFKFYITGSNSRLLSIELGSKLTGRHISFTLYPFSYLEYLQFIGLDFKPSYLFDTAKRGELKSDFNTFLQHGGLPEYLRYQDSSLVKQTYVDILYRDIITRYDIKSVKAFRELSLYFLSNISCLFSLRKLAAILEIGSVNTVKNYLEYLENSYLFFSVQRYSPSLKKQNIANKKVYCSDNGLMEAVAFQFSKNSGHYLENSVFIELKRRKFEVYYYKTEKDLEVDFAVRQGREIIALIQVCEGFENPKTRQREINGLIDAMNETNLSEGLILTLDHQEEVKIDHKIITIKPVYQWLLNPLDSGSN